MDSIFCRKCGNYSTASSQFCMSCGARFSAAATSPRPAKRGSRRAWLIVLGIVLTLGVIVNITVNESRRTDEAVNAEAKKTPEQRAAEEKTKQEKEARFQLAALGAKSLHDSARNPDAFKLSEVLLMDDGAACYTYRAQNGFGGMNVGHAVISPKGTLRAEESDGFQSLWNKECARKTGEDQTWEVGYAARLHGLTD